MSYIDLLPLVVQEDVRCLREKDASYGSSWKKRGGIGAFMMLARKWDRLEQMVAAPFTGGPAPYDILERIAVQSGSGVDGSVLAEVRDLRRYLALVEAELVDRGIVHIANLVPQPPAPPAKRLHVDKTDEWDKRNHRPIVQGSDGRFEVRTDSVPVTLSRADYDSRPPAIQMAYTQVTRDLCRLDETISKGVYDGLVRTDEGLRPEWKLADRYMVLNGHIMLDRRRWPQEDFAPRLAVELNHKEWSEIAPEWQALYKLDAGNGKHIMEPGFVKQWGQLP